jgi:hypothetical protein
MENMDSKMEAASQVQTSNTQINNYLVTAGNNI